jgi:thiamine biosynthesis lipoprotein
MKQDTRIVMGMPVAVGILGNTARSADIDDVFDIFTAIDQRFSPFREDSEVSRLNRGEVEELSDEMQEILALAEATRRATHGYFNVRRPNGFLDPSGIVKGWSIGQAANALRNKGFAHFYVDAGGDIQCQGKNPNGEDWRVGIRNPFCRDEIVKVVYPRGAGVATSGTYQQGNHIYDPHTGAAVDEIVSLTVIGPDIVEADRFATAAFAMGRQGIAFIEDMEGFEGYEIDRRGTARMTTGLKAYLT